MDARAITKALGGKWQSSYGLCRCPVHADRTPSLKVRDDARKRDGIDVHCFGGCAWQDIKAEWRREGLIEGFFPGGSASPPRSNLDTETDTDQIKRTETALKIWAAAVPLRDTLGQRYFVERRGLHVGLIDLEHAIRWHAKIGAVVALMTDPITNEPTGIHRTFLHPDGTKRERKMLGKQGVIRLSRDEEVNEGLGLTEGVEDGLAVLLSGWAPVWTATSAGGIERFPVLSGIESITIFADADPPGMKAAQACSETWLAADREARIFPLKDLLL